MTGAAVLEAFLAAKAAALLSAATITAYRKHGSSLLRHSGGQLPTEPTAFEAWLASSRSRAYAKSRMTHAGTFLRWAAARGLAPAPTWLSTVQEVREGQLAMRRATYKFHAGQWWLVQRRDRMTELIAIDSALADVLTEEAINTAQAQREFEGRVRTAVITQLEEVRAGRRAARDLRGGKQ